MPCPLLLPPEGPLPPQLGSLLTFPAVVLDSSPYSLSSLSVASTSWASVTLDTPWRTFLSLNKKAAHFPQVTLTTKSWDVLQVSHFCTIVFPSHKIFYQNEWHPAILTFIIPCGHNVVTGAACQVLSTRLPVSSLPHAPPSFWMTTIFLRKTRPTPLPQPLTAFASTQFWLFLPRSHTRLFHNPEVCGPIIFIFQPQNFSYPCSFFLLLAQDHWCLVHSCSFWQ